MRATYHLGSLLVRWLTSKPSEVYGCPQKRLSKDASFNLKESMDASFKVSNNKS